MAGRAADLRFGGELRDESGVARSGRQMCCEQLGGNSWEWAVRAARWGQEDGMEDPEGDPCGWVFPWMGRV